VEARTGRCSAGETEAGRPSPSPADRVDESISPDVSLVYRSHATPTIGHGYPHLWINLCVTPVPPTPEGEEMPDTLTDVLWPRILDALPDRVPGTALEPWLRPCRLLEPDGDRLRVAAPNSYTRDWILQNHLPALEHAAAEVIGGRPQLSIEVDGNLPRSSSPL